MRKDIAGWAPGVDVFPPLEIATVDFAGGFPLCTTENPLGHAVWWGLKPHQDPKQVCLCWDILFGTLPSTPHHAAKMPEERRQASLNLDACYTHWHVQLSPILFRFQCNVSSGAAMCLD